LGEETLKLALSLGIINDSRKNFYTKITSGTGSRMHFNESHRRFSIKKYHIRKTTNNLILAGFQSKRPECDCGLKMAPQYSRDRESYFYSCPNYKDWKQRGCGKTSSFEPEEMKIIPMGNSTTESSEELSSDSNEDSSEDSSEEESTSQLVKKLESSKINSDEGPVSRMMTRKVKKLEPSDDEEE
jgi:hypothetical protein